MIDLSYNRGQMLDFNEHLWWISYNVLTVLFIHIQTNVPPHIIAMWFAGKVLGEIIINLSTLWQKCFGS